jgi:adenylyl-sulfate kinase
VPSKRPPGLILWFTGLSGSGKSTLARGVKARLEGPVEVLDGDEVRAQLSKELGFSKEDRDTHVHRIGFVARAVARTGAIAIGAAISPYAQARAEVRALAEKDGLRFVEVHLHAPLEVLARRDPKGLYKKAFAGQLPNFTGVSDPYEPPESPELALDTSAIDEDTCLAAVLRAIEASA